MEEGDDLVAIINNLVENIIVIARKLCVISYLNFDQSNELQIDQIQKSVYSVRSEMLPLEIKNRWEFC